MIKLFLIVFLIIALLSIPEFFWWIILLLIGGYLLINYPMPTIICGIIIFLIYRNSEEEKAKITKEGIKNNAKKEEKDYLDGLIQNSKNYNFINKLSPADFEKLVGKIFHKAGYKTRETKYCGDKGIDLHIEKNGIKGIIQCKRYKDKIGTPIIRDFIGTMSIQKAEIGYIFTTSTYTIDAVEVLNGQSYNIKLIDTNGLSELMDWILGNSEKSFEETLEIANTYIIQENKKNRIKRKEGYEKYKKNVPTSRHSSKIQKQGSDNNISSLFG